MIIVIINFNGLQIKMNHGKQMVLLPNAFLNGSHAVQEDLRSIRRLPTRKYSDVQHGFQREKFGEGMVHVHVKYVVKSQDFKNVIHYCNSVKLMIQILIHCIAISGEWNIITKSKFKVKKPEDQEEQSDTLLFQKIISLSNFQNGSFIHFANTWDQFKVYLKHYVIKSAGRD